MVKITKEEWIEIINPSNPNEYISIKECDVSQLINDLLAQTGYEPLMEYFRKYEIADSIFVCLKNRNSSDPEMIFIK